MLITNLEFFPGKKLVKQLGIVQGNSIGTKKLGHHLKIVLQNIIGGELSDYTELLHDSREEAVYRMKAKAQSIGANAILNVRFDNATTNKGVARILAYGKAVVLE